MPFKLSSFLFGLSFLPLTKLTYRLLPYLRSIDFANATIQSLYPVTPTSFVLIQGATDGIGKQLAHHFNSLGYNLILHGRNQNKLLEMQRKIEGSVIVNCDLRESCQPIIEVLEKYDVKILVNSAGVTRLERFDEHSKEDMETLAEVNMIKPTQIIQTFFKKANNFNSQGNRLFINIASLTATSSFPLLSIYAATKAYQRSLLSSLALQKLNNHKILNVLPWYITTKMTGYKKTWDADSAKKLVEGIVKLIAAGRRQGTGSVKHEFIGFSLPIFKGYFFRKLEEDYSKVMEIMRRRGKRN